ncbi:MAG: iron chaperone [Candidatus Limnocylindria bacterium]
MVSSDARNPEDYLAQLPEDRRRVVSAVRDVIREHLPPGYEEGMSYGMIAWYVPLETFPDTYNGEPLGLAGIASQKRYISLYLVHVYGDPALDAWFRERWAATGKPLNMGKSCVRFTRLEDLPLDLIGEAIARADLPNMLAHYEAARGSARKTRAARALSGQA